MSVNRNLLRLDALEKQVEDLLRMVQQLNNGAQEEADATPIYTERLALDSTIKDGWRPKECTVTVQNAGGDAQTRDERRRRIAEAIEDGQAVADALNSQRDQVKRFA